MDTPDEVPGKGTDEKPSMDSLSASRGRDVGSKDGALASSARSLETTDTKNELDKIKPPCLSRERTGPAHFLLPCIAFDRVRSL